MRIRVSARSHRSGRWQSWRLLLVPTAVVAVVAQLSLAGSATGAVATRVAPGAAAHSVKPNRVNELDCNGWSAKYGTVRALAGDLCTDPVKVVNGHAHRFIDNGWYVGHDEPSVKFISSEVGSGNTMSYLMRMPRDPKGLPTATGSRTDYGQLSVAPWFGLPICDPMSYPQNACTPDSDTNIGLNNSPNAAGSAFMELQFYPPGFTPFIDAPSCSASKWCAALNIDSLECTFGFATCNNNCIEPVNFAFLQTNGVPAGPPSPQLADASTFTPNGHTLMMHSGDVVAVSITDPSAGFTVTVRDLTTHKTGYMTASSANGFMDTNIADCSGNAFTFHAEYSTAQIQNRVPWAALEGGVLMEQEIGHGEVCSSLANQDPVNINYPGGQSFSDPSVYDTCGGGAEGAGSTGEGPCNTTTGVCLNATTQGGAACPSDNFASGALCEYADGYCIPQGSRAITINGVAKTATSRANECYQNRFQNGDLDFDGQSYQQDWPNGSQNQPTTFQYAGPFTAAGHAYPDVQFETDVGGSSADCNVATGAGCAAPPAGANFYPFWSLGRASSGSNRLAADGSVCLWNFGNNQPNITVENFGMDAQYGTPDLTWYGGTLASAPLPNPEFAGTCMPSHSKS